MKLTVLVENCAQFSSRYQAEHGLSIWMEEGESKVLLDTGSSNLLFANAQKMGIDLTQVTDIVLSHGHYDHTGGLPALLSGGCLKQKTIVCHPGVWEEKRDHGDYIGTPIGLEVVQRVATVRMSKKPRRVSKRLMFLGEIPRTIAFENQKPLGERLVDGKKEPDFLLDDSALVYEGNEGIFLITGCSHSGICNIISYAKTLFPGQKVLGVIGGFHLTENNEQLQQTAAFLKKEAIGQLYPCHCTSFAAKAALLEQMPIGSIAVGEQIVVE